MAAPAQLTPGGVPAVSRHVNGEETLQAVLQVIDVRHVANKNNDNPSASDRFRMLLSDGVYSLQSMLATAENQRIRDGSIRKGSIIHLQEYTCSTIRGRRITIVLKLDVLQSECEIIGSPKPYELINTPTEQAPNLPANAAQVNSGAYSSGPGMLGSSVAPRVAQVANNVSHGGSYGGHPGMVSPPMGRAVEPVPNVSSGGSYGSHGTASAHNTMNADMVQSNLQQPSLNSHQNQRFAVPAMAGGSGTPVNTYGRPAQPFYQQPPPGNMNRGPATKNEATRAVPVAQLNPYQERWTIKARVTSKTDLRHYTNNKGPGKVFSFHLLDAQGGEIRATCFNVQADQFFDLIEVDKVYLISRGSLKPAQKKFNPLNHEYEITVDFRTSIEVCPSDDSSIPRQQYNFHQISEIENIEVGSIVDLVGIVSSVCPSATITRRDGSEAQKRTLQLKDMSGRSVEVTLWGKYCDAEGQKLQSLCDSGLNPVLALKSVRVTEFSCRSVSTISSTQLKIDPDFPEADKLRHWYTSEGKTAACVSLSAASSMGRTDIRKAVVQIKDENLGRSEKPDWITVKGAISHVNTESFCYPACTLEVNGRPCNKKVINNGDGTWLCERCDQRLQKCEYRYLLQCQIQDHTGLTYANAFHEPGVEILGYSAEELYNIKEEDAEQFAEIIQGVRWQQFLFKLKVYEETFNDEQRVKCQISKAEKLDLSRECSYLLKAIGALLQDDTGSPSEVQGAMAYNAGLNNSGTGQSVPASNSAYATSMATPRYGESANQLGQQANTYGGVSAPFSATRNVQTCMACGSSGHNAQNCPSGIYRRQQPAASTASSYGSSPGDAGSGPCYRCNQPGHFARNCPGVGAAPQQQPYGSGVASGAYGRQSYVRATNY
ncbi:replication protein A 70 kDa DNA-binding subunit C-like [Panicum miliaceum]|uniref:Replication protein A subunit n=1 Tax=Panicum miliaceum TaxID=4540 RepID=A0A3L6R6F9_PANMI|nr:replication protein A 70 kDa DNA-binding subunit C-like [Panicum miliaceum]